MPRHEGVYRDAGGWGRRGVGRWNRTWFWVSAMMPNPIFTEAVFRSGEDASPVEPSGEWDAETKDGCRPDEAGRYRMLEWPGVGSGCGVWVVEHCSGGGGYCAEWVPFGECSKCFRHAVCRNESIRQERQGKEDDQPERRCGFGAAHDHAKADSDPRQRVVEHHDDAESGNDAPDGRRGTPSHNEARTDHDHGAKQ